MPMEILNAYKDHQAITLCNLHYRRLKDKTAITGWTVKNGRLYRTVKEYTI